MADNNNSRVPSSRSKSNGTNVVVSSTGVIGSLLIGTLKLAKAVTIHMWFRPLVRIVSAIIRINSRRIGSYTSQQNYILKFPLLASDNIDASVVSRFVTLTQQEKAENIRTFFYNNDIHFEVGSNKNPMKQFNSRFYEEEVVDLNSEEFELTEDAKKSLSTLSDIKDKQWKLGKDFMPIHPTMTQLEMVRTDADNDDRFKCQFVGISVIPHKIPSNEFKIAFKYGIMNSRFMFRIIKFMRGDIGLFDLLFKRDGRELNAMMTTIALGEKSWNKALKDSTYAVTVLITIDEYNDICQNVVDLDKPAAFKHVQKDIGLLDLIIIDPYAKLFYRINSQSNYVKIRHDMRDALNASNKEVVIKTKFEASALNDVED